MDQKAALEALEANIVEACTNHELVHSKDKNYRACVSIGTDYFVKFGDPDDLLPEIQTQSYIFDYARSNPHPDAPRIPQVVHHFGDSMTMYLVMEFITLTAAPIDRIVQALVWLSSVPPPPDHVIGPLGGGPIRHKFFKDYTAPLLFSSVEALQRYMRKAYTVLSTQAQKQVSPVEISGDRLMFTQSDMHHSNFGVDQHGKTVLLDFAEIGLLPETFVAHTMSSEKRLAPIATALSLSGSSNFSMAAISSLLWMVASPRLGLDEHGNPTTRKAGGSKR
ncbi:hypothetical protein Hypma_000611 [Hypsizygus marmoreus]|uniref:Aminoglycoside phosphotransferase domain-containing protein n=1 Tax=Hypsizygus marmoreus TaxID=39966 RepID=A0A369J7U7_HYPMA|nr:hypothetical protein Hypma_000611 [Hypsizygus marmoreus]